MARSDRHLDPLNPKFNLANIPSKSENGARVYIDRGLYEQVRPLVRACGYRSVAQCCQTYLEWFLAQFEGDAQSRVYTNWKLKKHFKPAGSNPEMEKLAPGEYQQKMRDRYSVPPLLDPEDYPGPSQDEKKENADG